MDDQDTERREGGAPAPDDLGHPRGTLVIVLGFLMMLIGLWSSVYLLLLQRA